LKVAHKLPSNLACTLSAEFFTVWLNPSRLALPAYAHYLVMCCQRHNFDKDV